MKVNIHYFLEDDCTGSVHPDPNQNVSKEDAIAQAEEMINNANAHLENNREQWNTGANPPPEPQCVPIRWVLNDIIFHCNSQQKNDGVNLGGITNLNNQFGLNSNTEFNIYFLNHNQASGEADGAPGHSMVTTNFGRGLFNHEMGHVLGLGHSWVSDGISDTPELGIDFDFNCDGTIDFSERNKQCWDHYYDQNSYPNGPPGWDYDGDGIEEFPNACEPELPCTEEHPCCNWGNQNNNVMAYSKYVDYCGAFTEGQIRRMVELLSTEEYCEYIEVIGDACPPPMPNIEIIPNTTMTENCAFCFSIGASMNESEYLIEFFAGSSSAQTSPIYSTNWITGSAPNQYCIGQNLKYSGQYAHGFQPNTTYTIKLTVQSPCGKQKSKEISCTLPPINCDPEEPDFHLLLKPSPNPHQNSFSFEYELTQPRSLSVFLVNAINPSETINILTPTDLLPGSYSHTVQSDNLSDGVHSLIFLVDDRVYSLNVVKQSE